MEAISHTLDKVGERHQATLTEQQHLGQQAMTSPENLDPNWADDGITSEAAQVYRIGPDSIPRGAVPISFDNKSGWDGFHK